jgi:hypothetical protein
MTVPVVLDAGVERRLAPALISPWGSRADRLSGTPDHDAAGGRARAHLDGLGGRLGSLGGVERVADLAGGGANVEPGGGALADANVTSSALPGIERQFVSFSEAAAKASVSRIHNGTTPVSTR